MAALLFGHGDNFSRILLWIFHSGVEDLVAIASGVTVFFLSGYYLGRRAGYAIIVKSKSKFFWGTRTAILSLIAAAIFGTLIWEIRFIIAGQASFFMVMFPSVLLIIVGLLPAIGAGAWLGNNIEKSGVSFIEKYQQN